MCEMVRPHYRVLVLIRFECNVCLCYLWFHFISESVDEETRNPFRKRKMYCHNERYQGDSLYKRRRFFDRSSMVNSDGGMSSESVTNSPEKSAHDNTSGLAAALHGGP